MKLESEPRQRCAECGNEEAHMIRMERGGPFCRDCLRQAQSFLMLGQETCHCGKYKISACPVLEGYYPDGPIEHAGMSCKPYEDLR